MYLPLDSKTSAVSLTVKGKSAGRTGLSAFSARAPEKHNILGIHTKYMMCTVGYISYTLNNILFQTYRT